VAVFSAIDDQAEKYIVMQISKKGTQAIELSRAFEFIKGQESICPEMVRLGVTHILKVSGNINNYSNRSNKALKA
jgi:hypothetical protein